MNRSYNTSWPCHLASLSFACALATLSTSRAAADDTGTVADELCPSWSGFSAVGSVWEYRVGLFLFDGWERWEITNIDSDTGIITVAVSGERATDAFVYSYDREDYWLCDSEGLWSVGWTITWTISDPFGEFSESADSADEWSYERPMLPRDPMEGDMWTPTRSATLYRRTSEGDRDKNSSLGSYTLLVGPTVDANVLGEVHVVLPILRYYGEIPESGFQDSYTTWYAEDIGMVRRDDLILTDFTPGSP